MKSEGFSKRDKGWIGYKELETLPIEQWKSKRELRKQFFELCKQEIKCLLDIIKEARA
ncbi:hypothetical protein ACILE3_01250 [Capnocytophaga canimorsus]|uniref:hypothetical protein n=1 Tax=Capnocytophaga canimorsus TaxID=28188 RepID=UPI0037D5E079